MHPPRPTPPLTIALAGLVALGVAMGIGRFAFTPLLPMMLAEGSTDLPGASLLASANYLGYLLGALACSAQPWLARRFGRVGPVGEVRQVGPVGRVDGPRLLRRGLVATALLTLGMALPFPPAWPWLRLAAGVASAVVFVYTTGFCLDQLARRGAPAMGALIYVGPGLGIVASGLAATGLVAVQVPAAAGWAAFGVLAALMTAAVWRVFEPARGVARAVPGRPPEQGLGPQPAPQPRPAAARSGQMAMLTLAYGLAGIGYIVTATFLPVIAREALPGLPGLDLFWPLFGVGATAGALLASRLRPGGDQRLRLAGCYLIQAAGVVAGLVSPTPAGFALGSLLLGLPFTAITFFAMQEVRRVEPLHATGFIGLLTAAYGLGQIVGPPMAAWLVGRSSSAAAGFATSLWVAAALLVLGAALYGLMVGRAPAQRTV